MNDDFMKPGEESEEEEAGNLDLEDEEETDDDFDLEDEEETL